MCKFRGQEDIKVLEMWGGGFVYVLCQHRNVAIVFCSDMT